ncbi:MAG TPA: dihydroorotate dehydrogenase-like protein [Pyrinomonadaceae bacterium]|nr:dihydroorotate dehydrogenase-like protein [Pyrinomonadaceae bacterium]
MNRIDLTSRYLGLSLHNPLLVGSSPLTENLDTVKLFEDYGAGAVVLPSLYEEEITGEQLSDFFSSEMYGDSFPEASSYLPDPDSAPGPDEYLEHLRRVKQTVSIPVIASVNGSTPGGWVSHARLMEQAGADAIELHLYHAASDPAFNSAEVESQMLQVLQQVKGELGIPVAVKLSPLFTAFANFALQLDAAGADAIVLFTRFHKIDFDVIELEVLRRVELSSSADLDLRLRGTAVLSGRIKASLGITGGVHTALDVIKSTMAGAHAVQLVSALMRHGPRYLQTLRTELEAWMIANEWSSLTEMRGNMSFQKIPNPAVYERETFRGMFQ